MNLLLYWIKPQIETLFHKLWLYFDLILNSYLIVYETHTKTKTTLSYVPVTSRNWKQMNVKGSNI